jgi:hypothetical protein
MTRSRRQGCCENTKNPPMSKRDNTNQSPEDDRPGGAPEFRGNVDVVPPRSGWWRSGEAILGLVLFTVAVLMLELTCRTFLFWQQQGDYVLTELTVTRGVGRKGNGFRGVVQATGEEHFLTRVPRDYHEYVSRDPTDTRKPWDKVIGMKIPIWFARDHTSLFSSSPVHYVSEYASPPSGWEVLARVATTLAVAAIGIASLRIAIGRNRLLGGAAPGGT